MAKILVVAGKADPHVAAVARHFDARGVEYVEVNFQDLVDDGMACDLDAGIFSIAGKRIDDCTAIWYRRPRPVEHRALSPGHLDFARQEFRQAVLGMLRALPLHWVSHPNALRTASFKPLQYYLAKHRFGLTIPATLITSEPERARAFLSSYRPEECIAKPLGRPVIEYGDRMTYFFTNRLDQAAFAAIDQARYCPCILQPLIDKAYEVRATVIGEQIFAAKLLTEGIAEAQTDWRRAAPESLPHEPTALPEEIATACLAMCRHFDLRFGAFDFLVDREGVWHFLEVNPNGQWLWIEQMTGQPLASAMADELIQGSC